MNQLSAILAGFSITSAIVLLCAYLFFLREMRKTTLSKLACIWILLGLSGLQFGHFQYFVMQLEVLDTRWYCILLASLPVAFFFFARAVLFLNTRLSIVDGLHLVPLIMSVVIPIKFVPPMAFTLGTAYTVWISTKLFRMRQQRGRFKFEMFFFGLFALMAVIALVLGLLLPVIDHKIYYLAYSNSVSVAMVLVVSALLIFPELLSDIASLVEITYSKSKLIGINTDKKLADLESLMVQDKHYENEDLNLGRLAELLDLSSHQLSELINTELGVGFSRYVRQHRINAAKTLLISEPETSVLAISMMIGFKSQSSFYSAFKDATGHSPGKFRQLNLQFTPDL